MSMRIGSVLLAGGLLASAVLRAENTPPKALLVLSKSDHTLAIVDPSSLKVIARMPSGPDPHEVVASTDGKLAFISNYGGGAYNTLTVVDLVAQRTLPVVDLGALRGPHGLMFVGGKVWFTAEAAKAIGSYDPATKTIDWILGTGQNRTHMIYVFDDLKRLITSNVSSATMTIVEKSSGGGRGPGRGPGPGGPPGAPPGQPNGRGPGGPPPGMQNGPGRGPMGAPQGDWDETVVAVGRGAEGFDVSRNGKEIWAANAQDGTISIVDIAGKKVSQTLDANVMGANRLKFTPDGKLALVSTLNGPDLAIFDAATRREVKRVKIGRGAAGIQMQPDGSRAFVACTPDDYVAIVDLKTLQVTGHIDAGKEPDGLAWAVQR
ncbi:MAG: YncE family protein [Bryobacteraceae bacterium]